MTNSLKILDRLPVLVNLNANIPAAISRVLHVFLEPKYFELRPYPEQRVPENKDFMDMMTSSRTTLLLHPPKEEIVIPQENSWNGKNQLSARYKFYYSPWRDGILQLASSHLRSMEHFVTDLKLWLGKVNWEMWKDASLIGKLVRIAKHEMTRFNISLPYENKCSLNNSKDAWMPFITKLFLPSLSLSSANVGLSVEIWEVVKVCPYQVRWGFYGAWRDCYDQGTLRMNKSLAIKETKNVLK